VASRSSEEKQAPALSGAGSPGEGQAQLTASTGRLLRRRLLAAISLALTAAALSLAIGMALDVNAHHSPRWVDWATYSNALDRQLHGASPYDPTQLAGPYHMLDMSATAAIGYQYPPASLPLFLPFGSEPGGLCLWLALNIGLLLSGCYAILRRELQQDAVLYLGVATLPVLLWIGFIEGVTAGNITVGLCGVLAWAWAVGRRRTSPVVVAVIGVVKVFPATLVFWTTPSRLLRSIATAVVIAGAWVLVTLPFIGVSSWFDFFRAMANAQPNCESYGPSLTCVLQPVVGIGVAKVAAVGLAGALGLGATFVRADLLAFAMVALAWVVPAYDMSFYSLLPLFVVWVAAFAVGMRRLRAISLGGAAKARAAAT
jgi:hypothetical protein